MKSTKPYPSPRRATARVRRCRCAGACRCAGLVPFLLYAELERDSEFFREVH